jgi:thioredoxin reductase (NADPH)
MENPRMKPAMLIAGEDPLIAPSVQEQLERRYGADYEVVGVPRDITIEELSELCHGVALTLVDGTWDRVDEFLATVREVNARAARLIIAPWGMALASHRLQDLLKAGLADWYVIQPSVLPDEQFHRVVSEFVEEWSRENSPRFELVKIVDDNSPKGHRLRDVLKRNNVTHGVYGSSTEEGTRLLEQQDASPDQLPVLMLYNGITLVDPTERELSDAIGGNTRDGDARLSDVDVAVIGGGPSGLAAAVYGTSEGLSVVVLEREAIGGQAGTTSLVRNYLGFHRGITGQELASRAFRQAWAFGADVRFMREAESLRRVSGGFLIGVSDGSEIRARSVVLAQGVAYRMLGIEPLEALLGAGVYYGAAVTVAPDTRGKRVFVVGGGNSAGQAALHLSKFASHVTVLVRSASLAESMSDYLIEDIKVNPNISVQYNGEIVDGGGDGRLEWLSIRDRTEGITERVEADAVFILIGAIPATGWLPDEIAKDQWGFILTGRDVEDEGLWRLDRHPASFETSLPGVFAVGDVRRGSVKRVASAVGEGSVVIQAVHNYLHPNEVETLEDAVT